MRHDTIARRRRQAQPYDDSVTRSALNRGIYDAVEAAALLHVHPEWLVRWSVGPKAIIPPEFRPAFSFVDLISLRVVKQLWDRRVAADEIASAHRFLADEFEVDRPFAHRRAQESLATAEGKLLSILDADHVVDAGRSGQGVFRAVVEPVMKGLEYDDRYMANLWRPRDRIWLNPRVQAGAPCVDQRRIPTAQVAGMVALGDSPHDIADDFDLSLKDVEAAVQFEASLLAA